MFKSLLSITKARQRFTDYVTETSEAMGESLRSRKVKKADGEEVVQHYAVEGRCISDGAEKTGWAIIRLAIKQLERIGRTPQLTLEEACQSILPPVATNSRELGRGKVRGSRVSDRTIRNHIKELRSLGLITKRKFRGTKADYYLWIKPDFLCDVAAAQGVDNSVETAAAQEAKKLANLTFEGRTGTNFPLNKLLGCNNKEIETRGVDKLLTAREPGSEQANNSREEEVKPTPKKATGGAAAALAALAAAKSGADGGAAQVPAEGGKTGLSQGQRAMIEQFFHAAWQKLYAPRNVQFNDQQQRQFKNAVWAGVYGGFRQNWSEQTWQHYHAQALERLEMAAKYFARNTHKWPPMPYAEFVPGTGYFDIQNKRGFIKTFDWHEVQQANRRRWSIQEAMRSARRQWNQHLLGKAPKKVQQRSLLELFRYHENKFKKWGKQALDTFYASFQNPAVLLSKPVGG